MWFEKSVMYHIYPLGLCGAPAENDGKEAARISRVEEWIPHMNKNGIDSLYLGPVFESDKHGYDTRDYKKLDCRLGRNEDLSRLSEKLHEAGIKLILDGVFNHVGRGFWAFQDVLEKRESSEYLDWFHIDLCGDSNYQDGLWYEGWEGHYELIKLNLDNEAVVEYLLSAVDLWMDEFQIDGLRLDVAYMLNRNFMRRLCEHTKRKNPEFFLIGEIIHGDYNEIVNKELLDSCTNYECYKGLYSSFNSGNMYEIAHSLNRQFGPEEWTLYKGKHIVVFADNHDTDRIGSTLTTQEHLELLYGMMFGMPGIPCIYYGSEWGIEGKKADGDDSPVRPALEKPVENKVSRMVSKFAEIHKEEKAIVYGSYRQVYLTNHQIIFERAYENDTIYVAVNIQKESHQAHIDEFRFTGKDLVTGEEQIFEGQLEMRGNSVSYWKVS